MPMLQGFSFPVLSLIIWIPILVGVGLLFIDTKDGKNRDSVRGVALSAAVAMLVLSAGVFFQYNSLVTDLAAQQAETLANTPANLDGTTLFKQGLRFEENFTWVESLGINYHLAVDGLNAPMILLT